MSRTDWKAPLVVGAVVRVLVWAGGLPSHGWVQTDTPQYWWLSADLLAGYSVRDGYLYDWGLMRPPGYPLLLALMRIVTDSDQGVALLQIGFGVAAIGLTYALAARLADRTVAAIAAWWLAVSPIHVVDSSVLLTEVPFSVFLLAAVLLVAPIAHRDEARPWRWAAAGLTLGFATLIRPIALYLPVAVLLAVLASRHRRRLVGPALVLLAASALPAGAWIARNYTVTGVATISTIQGLNLAYYRAAGAIAAEEGIPIEAARERIDASVRAESFRGMNLGELAQIQERVGMREIARHPTGYALAAARGLGRMLVGPARSHFVERFQDTRVEFVTMPLVAASAASAILLTLASAIGTLAWLRARAWRPLLLVGVPLGYMLLVSAGHEAWARFRVPLEPLLVVLAAVGIMSARRALAARRGRAR